MNTCEDRPSDGCEAEEVELWVGRPEDAERLAAALPDVADDLDSWLRHDLCVVAGRRGAPVGLARLVDAHGHAEVSDLAGADCDAEILEALLRGAEDLATDLGSVDLVVPAPVARRRSLPPTYRRDGDRFVRVLPTRVEVPTTGAMHGLGAVLAQVLRPGDIVLASGDLGAGKTTLAQGIGMGLGVEDPVISPTFVLARRHRGASGRPGLVHVDAYRLGSAAELVDLDLDETMDSVVTLIEWGAGIAEDLGRSHLDVDIRRSGDPEDETRIVYLEGIGPRWRGVDLSPIAEMTLRDPDESNDSEQTGDEDR